MDLFSTIIYTLNQNEKVMGIIPIEKVVKTKTIFLKSDEIDR